MLYSYLMMTIISLVTIEVRGWGWGGVQKIKWKTPSPNFEELIENIPNIYMYYFFIFSGGSR